jgi:asparagine synthase (glutamine-hydrolysing)
MICNRGKSLPTISIVSPSKPKYNEQRWIESVIEKYKCDGTFIDGDLFKPFASFPNNLAEPSNLIIGDALHSAVAAAAIANGTRVLLSGLGGDQVCYGDHPRPFHLADLALRGRWLSLAKELRAQSNADPSRRAIAFYLKHDVVRTIGNFLGRRPLEGSQDPGLAPWATSMLRQITAIERKTQYPKLSRYVSVQGYLERVLSVGRLASQQKAYRSSIEMRFPMFYAPLVALMSSLPHELRFNPSEDRLLQRLALKGILPELVRTRRIQGGSENLLFEALRADRDLYDLVREGRHVGRLGLVDLDAWRIWVSRARFGQVFHLTQFFSVVALELWLDHRNWANLKAEPTS